ncbi:MAG: hypothetical protein JWN83_894 [Chitinophagaceae bacterium]|nr:hypothetical protein [Chitinophagaceae bacterium]
MLHRILISTVVLFIACNSSTENRKDDMSALHQTIVNDTSGKQKENVKEISSSFTNVDSKAAAVFTSVINKYLELKNALADNDEPDAQKKGKELFDALSKIDKSLLPPEQKKVYEQEEEDLKENAEHIGKSKLEHQRMHFSILSESIYVIAKSFGAGRPLYHLFCSKAEDSKGAMWLSESPDLGNPYLGKGTGCIEVIEKIR